LDKVKKPEKKMTKVIFLGTGGGRFVTLLQVRGTGGIYVIEGNLRLHIDPGPGALIRLKEAGLNPIKTDALLISHSHTDHYTDAEVLIEGMAQYGRKQKGVLIGSKSVIEGVGGIGPAISTYHKSKLKEIHSLQPGESIKLEELKIEGTLSKHSDPTTIGFKLYLGAGIISYVSDTEFFEELINIYRGTRLLIVCMVRPLNAPIPFHLSTESAEQLIEGVRPELAIITHMGMKALRENPWAQAKWIVERSGIKTIPAQDGMSITLDKEIKVEKALKKK
jgi:phosphoribosyl 1,2-cyclic phosphodiesterase